VDRVPAPGGEIQAGAFSTAPGGGFAFLLAAKRAGADAVHCCPHGTGPNGDTVRAALVQEGIPTALAPDPRGDTGHCVVLTAPDGERTMVSWPGVESRVTAEGLRGARPGDAVVLSGYALRDSSDLPDFLAALPADTILIFDPTPIVASLARGAVDAVLARADWVSGNKAEIDALPTLAGGVISRDGAQGAWLIERGAAPLHVPAPRVEARDTTGAGDVHVATFAAGLVRGLAARAALEAANAASAAHVAR
jgi:sugar/nucleoside kinase (ribokinase family)